MVEKCLFAIILISILLFSLGSCSRTRSAENRIASLRLFSEDEQEVRISDLGGDKKLLLFFLNESGCKRESAYKLTEVFGDTIHMIAVFQDRIPEGMKELFSNSETDLFYCNSKSIFKEEVQIFLTDKDGEILSSFGSSYAGAAAVLSSYCDREKLRKKVTELLLSENAESFSGDTLLIAYKPTCRKCAEMLQHVYDQKDRLSEKYNLVTLVSCLDELHPEFGNYKVIDVSEIYLKALRLENNIGFFLIQNGEYTGGIEENQLYQ